MRTGQSPTPAGPFISIRTKLAAATVVVIAAVAAAGYEGLSSHERRNLLTAKEVAAVMMAGFFDDSIAAALAFDDAKDVEAGLRNLGRNDEVVFAAVFGIDSDAPARVGAKLGELPRTSVTVAVPEAVPSVPTLRRTPDWVLVESAVRDPSGQVIGVSQVAFSLARENASIAKVERRALALFTALAVGLSGFLLGLAHLIIVRPLSKLATATRRLERGEHVPLEVVAHDEIGGLARAFRSMSSAIQARELEISARNRDMRLVLDNVEEGFLTVGRDGIMSDERSAVIGRWFGPPSTRVFADYLAEVDESLGAWFSVGWDSVIEDLLPLEVSLAQLPRAFRHHGCFFEVRYRPIVEGETLSQVLVIIADVTARVQRERAEVSQREMMEVCRRVLADRAGFDEFFAEATALVDAIEDGGAPDDVLRRHVHTLKGNAGLFGLERVVALCHELEATGAPPTVEERVALGALWSDMKKTVQRFAPPSSTAVEVRVADYEALLEALDGPVDRDGLRALVRSWQHEAVETRLARVAEQVRALARRLGRGEVNVTWTATPLRMPAQRWAPFWSSLAHVVRNVVDHAIQSGDEREVAGKPRVAAVTIGAVETRGELIISIADDGPGIDWATLAAKSAARGLPHESKDDLEQALFADGVSTRDEVSAISGRGVGMAAVRAAVEAVGGKTGVESAAGAGTTFRFAFPLALLDETKAPPPRLRGRAPQLVADDHMASCRPSVLP